ncbi:Endoglucanase A [Micractinium conductrix]|uniref:cellulase n=1 Tax=Micractinium conductrix TaxID=554055 RepID=A0A2P6VBA6_9CHLO|nr:Endoglucanase A [Micractinium conductrix]|eukprot:PSC71377.1 Endoglucanase A [Micractinium conductrix]
MYAQRSGKLSGAVANPIPWRSDSHLNDPVVGGFYDAGDTLKLQFPLATSLAFLAWGALEFPQGYAAAGATEAALDNLRWGAAFLMACHPSDNVYIAQIGEPGADHSMWGRPEEDTSSRPAYTWDASKPASDAAGAAASALAATSLLFTASDPAFAAACLDHAQRLFAFASKYEGKYSASQPGPTYVYPSTQFEDDLAFAAAWLYRATREPSYLEAARTYLKRAQYSRNYFVSWDSVFIPADILLLSLGAGPVEGVDHAWQVDEFLASWQQGKNGIKFSPQGLALAPLGGWGNLRHSANAAFMQVLHAKHTADAGKRTACLAWARKQIDYMLGLAGSDRSFVVGYGRDPPTHPHHRAASCPPAPAPCTFNTAFTAPGPNPHVIAGALVGGPGGPGDAYTDVRSDFKANEVAVDYQAGFTGALAGLTEMLATQGGSS